MSDGELICRDCGNIFYACEAGRVKEPHDEIPGGFYETFFICPVCGSTDYEDAAYCDKCGGAFLEDKLYGGHYCNDCIGDFLASSYVTMFAQENLDEFAEFVYEKEACKCSSQRGT